MSALESFHCSLKKFIAGYDTISDNARSFIGPEVQSLFLMLILIRTLFLTYPLVGGRILGAFNAVIIEIQGFALYISVLILHIFRHLLL